LKAKQEETFRKKTNIAMSARPRDKKLSDYKGDQECGIPMSGKNIHVINVVYIYIYIYIWVQGYWGGIEGYRRYSELQISSHNNLSKTMGPP
jgi:hypothetical protein